MASVMEKILGRGENKDVEMKKMMECECTAAGLGLREAMRKVWDDHVFWTREVVLTAAVADSAESPLVGAAVKRLMKNQEDIGMAVVPFYGKEAGDMLTSLLRDHIQQAIDIVLAAKMGDSEKQAKVTEMWYANANDISRLLSDANPKYWPYDAVAEMMKQHLDLTTAEAVSVLQGNYEQAVMDFEAVRDEIIMMSDTIADGIMMQFPEKFKM
jgi:hypothetical protein